MARANNSERTLAGHAVLLFLAVICFVITPDMLLAGTSSGGTQTGVKICRTFRLKNNSSHDPANDLHFKIWQREDNIDINGWTVTIDNCSNVTSGRSTQPDPHHDRLKNHPDGTDNNTNRDNGQHAVDVNASGCSVDKGQSVKITVCFWLTHYNTLRKADVRWTFNGGSEEQGGPNDAGESDNPTPNPPGGNNNPFVGDSSFPFRHVTRIVNDDTVRFMLIRGLTFHTSATDYPDLDSVVFSGKVLPDTVLGPGEAYVVNVLTPTPYFGNYVYASWDIYEYFPGPIKSEGDEMLSSSDLFQHEVPDTMGTIPTLSEWGLIILAFLILSGVIWVVIRRHRRVVAA